MPIEKLRLLAVLVVSAGVTALLSGDFSPIFFMVLCLSVAPMYWDIDLQQIRERSFWRIYGLSTFVVVGLMFWLNVQVQISVFLLVLFSIIYELYGERRPEAPARLIPLLSFLVVLYESRIESGLNLMVGILLYIYAIVWCLVAFHAAPRHDYAFGRILRQTWWPALRVFSVTIVLGFAFFWMIPRLEGQTLSAIPTLGGDRISGFGERVNLNDIGSLKLSRKHVLDLKLISGEIPNRYLKGRTFDRYEKGTWSTSTYALSYPLPEQGSTYLLRPSPGDQAEFAIDLEPLHGNTLFFFDTLEEIKGVPQPLRIVGDCEHLSIVRNFPMALSYTFKSGLYFPRASDQADLKIYTQIPKKLKKQLDIINRALVKKSDTLEARVNKTLAWFKRDFTYSLDINNQDAREPILAFLKESRSGHCELFASSMVMLMRAQGYKARLVTGFYLPDIHPSGRFYYVTESDAHAWVEILYGDTWLAVDPTPPTEPIRPGFFESKLATLKHFWRSNVMAWNYDRQSAALSQGRTLYARALNLLFNRTFLLLGFAILLGVILLRQRQRNSSTRLTRIFAQCDQLLQRRFGRRSPNLGLYAYLASTQLSALTLLEYRNFLDHYYKYRFGGSLDPLVPEELLQKGQKLLKHLRREFKGKQ